MHDPVILALAEDIGSGDLTSQYFVSPDAASSARIFAKENCILAGADVAARVFAEVDSDLRIQIIETDGTPLLTGDTVLTITGKASSILTAERVALNFVQRLSGIATLTNAYVSKTTGTKAQIFDTRKTTPGLRLLEKAAVKAGGGTNHRIGLHDMVMVKDNHLLAGSTIADLQKQIDRFKNEHSEIRVELEADRPEQVREFLTLRGVDVILLDNMSLAELRECVALPHENVSYEASGGINLETVGEIAKTGVDFISVGALTHSARAIDFSLELT